MIKRYEKWIKLWKTQAEKGVQNFPGFEILFAWKNLRFLPFAFFFVNVFVFFALPVLKFLVLHLLFIQFFSYIAFFFYIWSYLFDKIFFYLIFFSKVLWYCFNNCLISFYAYFIKYIEAKQLYRFMIQRTCSECKNIFELFTQFWKNLTKNDYF